MSLDRYIQSMSDRDLDGLNSVAKVSINSELRRVSQMGEITYLAIKKELSRRKLLSTDYLNMVLSK